MSNLLYLIDTFSLVFQVFHAIPEMTGPSGQPTNAVFGFTRDLQMIRNQLHASHLVCAIDAAGPAVRNQTYADYKANRSEIPVDLAPQIPLILEVIDAFNVPAVGVAGWEADDVIATLACQAAENGFQIRIVTNDKDVRQLLGPQIQIFNVRKNAFYDERSLLQEWGIRPGQVVDFQSLVGDSVDNVPGVPLIGPKKASALLQEYETLDRILENADNVSGAKLKENLRVFADQARMSRQLVELNTHLPIEMDWESARVTEPDRPRLRELFTSLGFRRLAEEMRDEGEVGTAPPPSAVPVKRPASRSKKGTDQPSPTAISPEEISDVHSPLSGSAAPATAPVPLALQLVDTPESLARLIAELKQQKRYALAIKATSENPHQSDIQGWGISWQRGIASYIPVDGAPGQRILDANDVAKALKPVLEAKGAEVVGHDLKQQILLLRRVGIALRSLGVDPMVGDYLLDAGARTHSLEALAEKYLRRRKAPAGQKTASAARQKQMFEVDIEKLARGTAENAETALELAVRVEARLKEQGLWGLYWDLERPLIGVLADMEAAGIRVDTGELTRQSEQLTERLAELMREIHTEAGTEFNIDSPIQLRRILFDKLGLPVVKKTKTGASTDQEVLERLALLHSLPAKIIEHRQLSKLKSTYLDALPTLVNPATGRIHCLFNQVVAATGRLSSSDPNLQNIPIRTPEGRQIRRAFLASETGRVLLCADYSQIELRMLAHFSGDPALQAAFRERADIHTTVASEIFSVPPSEVTSEMRRVAKAVNFGVIYGQSPFGLSAALNIGKEEAAQFIRGYFERYTGVDRYLRETLEQSAATGYATTILGRRRAIEGIRVQSDSEQSPHRQRNLAERTAINAVIQGSAADLIKRAMLKISERLCEEPLGTQLLLQIHDELIFDVGRPDVARVARIVRHEMEHALQLSVPLEVRLSMGDNWLDLEPIP